MSTLHYRLDTNIVSDLMRRPQGPVAQRLAEVGIETVAISIVVACELRFGAAKINAPRLNERLDLVLDQIPSLPLEAPVETHYADIRNTLERAGTPIGPNDLLIAAQARALDLVLVTDNLREFAHVPGLGVESWLADPANI